MSNIKYPFKTWWFNDEEWVSKHRAQEMANLLSSKDAEIQQLRDKLKQLESEFATQHSRKATSHKSWKEVEQGKEIQRLKEELTQMANTSRHTETQLRHKINELESKGATREQIEKVFNAGCDIFDKCVRPEGPCGFDSKLFSKLQSKYIKSQFPQGDVKIEK